MVIISPQPHTKPSIQAISKLTDHSIYRSIVEDFIAIIISVIPPFASVFVKYTVKSSSFSTFRRHLRSVFGSSSAKYKQSSEPSYPKPSPSGPSSGRGLHSTDSLARLHGCDATFEMKSQAEVDGLASGSGPGVTPPDPFANVVEFEQRIYQV